MSETVAAPPEVDEPTAFTAEPVEAEVEQPKTSEIDPEARPWHGAYNPYEAIYAHFTAEIAALKAKIGM